MNKKKIGIVLAVLMFVTMGTAFMTNVFLRLFPEDEIQAELPKDDIGGLVIGDGEGNGINLTAVKLMSSEYEDYGVSALAESAYTLTATVYPEDASNKALDWIVSFVDPSASWAVGKTVTDYVTVTPTSDGALTAVVANVEAFGAQMEVKATSRDNPEVSATCTVDYLQRIMGYSVHVKGVAEGYPIFSVGFGTGNSTEATVKPDFSKEKLGIPQLGAIKHPIYTIENTIESRYYTLKPTDGFKAAVGEDGIGLFEASGEVIGSSVECNPIDFFGSSFNLYKDDPDKMNKFIDIIDTYDAGAFYELTLYEAEGGAELAKFNILLDASIIKNQKAVESLEFDEMGIVFSYFR